MPTITDGNYKPCYRPLYMAITLFFLEGVLWIPGASGRTSLIPMRAPLPYPFLTFFLIPILITRTMPPCTPPHSLRHAPHISRIPPSLARPSAMPRCLLQMLLWWAPTCRCRVSSALLSARSPSPTSGLPHTLLCPLRCRCLLAFVRSEYRQAWQGVISFCRAGAQEIYRTMFSFYGQEFASISQFPHNQKCSRVPRQSLVMIKRVLPKQCGKCAKICGSLQLTTAIGLELTAVGGYETAVGCRLLAIGHYPPGQRVSQAQCWFVVVAVGSCKGGWAKVLVVRRIASYRSVDWLAQWTRTFCPPVHRPGCRPQAPQSDNRSGGASSKASFHGSQSPFVTLGSVGSSRGHGHLTVIQRCSLRKSALENKFATGGGGGGGRREGDGPLCQPVWVRFSCGASVRELQGNSALWTIVSHGNVLFRCQSWTKNPVPHFFLFPPDASCDLCASEQGTPSSVTSFGCFLQGFYAVFPFHSTL